MRVTHLIQFNEVILYIYAKNIQSIDKLNYLRNTRLKKIVICDSDHRDFTLWEHSNYKIIYKYVYTTFPNTYLLTNYIN